MGRGEGCGEGGLERQVGLTPPLSLLPSPPLIEGKRFCEKIQICPEGRTGARIISPSHPSLLPPLCEQVLSSTALWVRLRGG